MTKKNSGMHRLAKQLKENAKKVDELATALNELTRCDYCYGSGSVLLNNSPDECPRCRGTGKK